MKGRLSRLPNRWFKRVLSWWHQKTKTYPFNRDAWCTKSCSTRLLTDSMEISTFLRALFIVLQRLKILLLLEAVMVPSVSLIRASRK